MYVLAPTGIIITTTQLLSLLLSKLRQPRGEHPASHTKCHRHRLNETHLYILALQSSLKSFAGQSNLKALIFPASSTLVATFSILLGPTAMGRVPGFTEHIFPQESRSYLNLCVAPIVSSTRQISEPHLTEHLRSDLFYSCS